MKRKFIMGLIIAGIVFSSINIDFKSVKADTEIKFRGTAIEYFSIIGGWGWYVIVDEVISGPSSGLQGHNVSVSLAPLPPDQYPPGYMDPHIEPGDKVEVYGLYQGGHNVALYGSNEYYIKISSAEGIEVKFRGVVTDMFFCYCLGNNVNFEINIDEIISDPSNNLNIGEALTVPPTCENLAYVDPNITVGDRVEVYGIYEKPIDGPIMIRLEESYHYIKKIGVPCGGMNCDQYDGFVGEKYCKNGDVYQKYRDYYCENGECKYREEERKIKDCDYGCENGECKPKPTTPPPTTQPPTTSPPTTVSPTTSPPPGGLTPEQKMVLAEEYAPTLYFYKSRIWGEEEFFLIEAEYFKDISLDPSSLECYDIPGIGYANVLTYQEEYDRETNPVYVRVTPDMMHDGKEYIVIQYWFHYLYNHRAGFNHEGEWEMIEVILEYDDAILRNNEFPKPQIATYSQHKWGETHRWSDSIIEKKGHHPIVYVAWGTHASYFDGSGILPNTIPDHRNKGIEVNYNELNLELLDNKEWLDFSGKWGGDDNSPPGPQFQGEKWDHPLRWAEKYLEGSTELGLGSPAHLLIKNEKGQRIGYVEGEFVNEIPNAYTLTTEEHEFYHLPNDEYSVEITAFEEGEIDFDVRINDNGEVTYISYKDKVVTSNSKAYTDIDPGKKEYEIKMDKDGDGTIDETIEPDEVVTYESGEEKSSSQLLLLFGVIIVIVIASIVLVISRRHTQISPRRSLVTPPREHPEIPLQLEKLLVERNKLKNLLIKLKSQKEKLIFEGMSEDEYKKMYNQTIKKLETIEKLISLTKEK